MNSTLVLTIIVAIAALGVAAGVFFALYRKGQRDSDQKSGGGPGEEQKGRARTKSGGGPGEEQKK